MAAVGTCNIPDHYGRPSDGQAEISHSIRLLLTDGQMDDERTDEWARTYTHTRAHTHTDTNTYAHKALYLINSVV